jgi:flavin-dependent dehydrogenase
MTHDPRQRIADALPGFPYLKARLCGAEASSRERGAQAGIRRLRCVTRGHIALVGDASGTVDPITGEGICAAFKQAQALARAMAGGNLGAYERDHVRLMRRPRFMSDFMLLMDRSAMLRHRAMAAFQRHPALFANLLSMHVGKLHPVRFALTAAALGWDVATA